jgi:hypothetical protein
MSGKWRNPSPRAAGRAGAFGAAIAATLLLAGCGGGSSAGANNGSAGGTQNIERLSGPNIDIVVTIPDGWHQVIDSSNPSTPEMVYPVTCMGSAEVSCATGLARLATFAAPSAQAAAETVQKAVSTSPGVQAGNTISQGPGQVGHRDGYRFRFNFSNATAKLVSEVAAVPTGSPAADSKGNHEFSVVLVWVSNVPNAPKQDVIDQIVGSALVAGGHP